MNVYEIVTNRIIEQLEKGVVPWQRPWTGVRSGAHNRVSGKPYSLLNQMLLKRDGEYATFKQWAELGGRIRKREKAETVVFWKIQQVTEKNEDGEEVKKSLPLLRYYNVFHVSQVDGVEPKETAALAEGEPIEAAEKVKEDYKGREHIEIIETISNKAYYSPSGDYIKVPCKEQYTAIEEFYSTLFHEMVHSTGHKSRLNRLEAGAAAHFGGKDYSKEELVAEIGSASLLNMLGIETAKTFNNSAAYIHSWIKVLKDDTRFIVSASSRAEKAVNFIMGAES